MNNTVVNSASSRKTSGARGVKIPPQSIEEGFDQSWYPICLSAELSSGSMLSVEFMNGRVIAVRDAAGVPHVMSAFCRHLGADLGGGVLIEGTVRCPYHHWRYDMQGQCVATAIDRPPAAARLFSFPVHESMGLIWAFNGTEPLFDPPAWELPDASLTVKATREHIEPVDHYIPFSNSCDIQHLMVVHGIKLEVNPQDIEVSRFSIKYLQDQIDPLMGPLHLWIKMQGSNTLMLWAPIMGRPMYMMSTGRPLPGNRTQIFQAAATPEAENAADRAAADAMIEQSLAWTRKLMHEDGPVISNISFRQDVLTHSDRVLARYFDWVRQFPRSNAACEYIAK